MTVADPTPTQAPQATLHHTACTLDCPDSCSLEVEVEDGRVAKVRAASPAVIRCGWGVERNRNGGSAVAAILALPAVAGKFKVRAGGYTMSNSGAFRDVGRREPSPGTRIVNMNHVGRVLTDPDAGVALLPKGVWFRSTESGANACALAPDTLTDVGAGACFNDARVDVGALVD